MLKIAMGISTKHRWHTIKIHNRISPSYIISSTNSQILLYLFEWRTTQLYLFVRDWCSWCWYGDWIFLKAFSAQQVIYNYATDRCSKRPINLSSYNTQNTQFQIVLAVRRTKHIAKVQSWDFTNVQRDIMSFKNRNMSRGKRENFITFLWS